MLEESEKLLGEDEQVIIDSASSFLRLGIPAQDEKVKVHTFISKAIVHQEELSSLKFALSVVYSRKWHKLREVEADNWRDLRGEYSHNDAKFYQYEDSKVRDLSHQVDTYKAFIDRVESLIWQLKKVIEVLDK